MPRLLELCSGTGSLGRAFTARGWDEVSVDCDPCANSSICCDLLELTAERCLACGPIDFVWVSPPCTFYSIARTTGPPADLATADRLVQKCLDLAAELGAPSITRSALSGAASQAPGEGGVKGCAPCMLCPGSSALRLPRSRTGSLRMGVGYEGVTNKITIQIILIF
jgi:hypothetical protein